MIPSTPQKRPGEHLVILGEHQPEYLPLPAYYASDGYVTTEWEPTDDERARIAAGGRVRITVYAAYKPFNPIKVEGVDQPTETEVQ